MGDNKEEESEEKEVDSEEGSFFKGNEVSEPDEDEISWASSKDLRHYKEKNEDDIPLLDDAESIDLKEFINFQTDEPDDASEDTSNMWGDIEDAMDHKVDDETKFRQVTKNLLKDIQLDNNPDN